MEPNELEYERLRNVWQSQGQPELFVLGSVHYRVFTPNGTEQPVFSRLGSEEALYGSVSMSRTPGQKPDVEQPPAKRPAGKRGVVKGG